MIDQLHVFPDKATAEAVFGDGEGAASWLHNGLTVMPCQIMLHDLENDTEEARGTRPADGYWMGAATHLPDAAAAAQALPSCRVAYVRPETPTPWREAITWSAPGITDLTVISAGSFAGSGYVFD
jgi:hypothetical protein